MRYEMDSYIQLFPLLQMQVQMTVLFYPSMVSAAIPILNIDDKDMSEKVIIKSLLQEILIYYLSKGQKINPHLKL